MPCRGGPEHPDDRQEKIDKLTRMLCEACDRMLHLGAPIERAYWSNELVEWYEEHEAADAERIRQEQKKLRDRELRTQALAKLSKEERKVLGFR